MKNKRILFKDLGLTYIHTAIFKIDNRQEPTI